MLKRLGVFVLLLVMAASPMQLAGCSGAPAAPGPSDSFAPSPAVMKGEFTIAYPCPMDSSYAAGLQKSMAHMQGLLNEEGWGIRLRMINVGEESELEAVRRDMAAGLNCDGYMVTPPGAEALLDAGLTMDLRPMLPDAAPMLYSRYRTAFGDRAAGVPIMVIRYPLGTAAGCILRKGVAEAAGIRIEKMSDVLALLEKGGATVQIGAEFVRGFTGSCSIFEAWAGEKGYYPLSRYGISGNLYAALTDGRCTPVPVEDIPGFSDFFARCLKLKSENRIVDMVDLQESSADSVVGYIGQTESVNRIFLFSQHRTAKDYDIYPLAGCETPSLPPDDPDFYCVLAVSAASGRAEQIVKLVQWTMSSRDNALLASYGEEGVDYRAVDGEVEFLLDGKELTVADWNSGAVSDRFSIANLGAPEMENLEAPAGGALQPLWDVMKHKVGFSPPKFDEEIYNKYNAVIDARANLFEGWLHWDSGDLSVSTDAAAILDRLRELDDETRAMAGAYAVRNGELLGGKDK